MAAAHHLPDNAMSQPLDDLHILPPCSADIRILREDEHFLLVDKPAGLLSVPGRHPANRDCVISRLLPLYPGAAAVHRLDFATSGLLVVPLNKAALSHIGRQFQARTVAKRYTAVVRGQVAQDQGEINLPIAVDREQRPRYKICHEQGKPSVTGYQVISRDAVANTTRLSLAPITGRSHQLRLHLQAIGHPILGCEFYADEDTRAAAPRLLLHATELRFLHPVTGEPVAGVSEPGF